MRNTKWKKGKPHSFQAAFRCSECVKIHILTVKEDGDVIQFCPERTQFRKYLMYRLHISIRNALKLGARSNDN